MRIFKILFWGLMIGTITLVISQNLEFFASPQKLKINLWFWQYETPQTLNGIVFVGFFVIGFLFCYFIDFVELFKARRSVKTLNRECDKHVEEIGNLKNRLESLQKTSANNARARTSDACRCFRYVSESDGLEAEGMNALRTQL
ncbi:MAG: LapA family protein [Desulfobacteraceae bacterium]|nr:LapA family protein [Desulfobacteraceae bacterium]